MKKLLLLLIATFILVAFNKKDTTWVALGDSITYLNDHPNETDNKVEKGYMTRVTQQLKHIHYTNKGFNGWTAVGIAQKIDNLGLEKADIYSVFLGTNDWWSGQPVGTLQDYQMNTGTGTYFGAYRIIINKLRSLNPQAKIVLITPMQRVDFFYFENMKNNAWGSYKEKNGQSLEQFAAAVKTIGKQEHFKVVDLYHKKDMGLKDMVKFKRVKDPATGNYKAYTYPDFIDIPVNPETDEYPYPAAAMNVTYDGLHPSDKGNQIIADMLVKVMKRY
jgi:lysophospholipase L1-like esterase